MDNIEQRIIKLYEDGINYQIINNEKNKYEYTEKNTIKNHNEFISILKQRKGISIITGNNGIGKTYLLKLINDKFIEENKKTKLIELKKYTSLNEIEKEILKQHEIIIFDGLDEINMNIIDDVINYIFSISNKKVIVSSRKDFLQKNNMLNVIYNVYEIMPIEEYKVKKIIEELDIEDLKTDNIMNLLKIPRFLLYIINNIEQVKNLKKINKYNILNLIIENHLDTLNNRANTKIEKHIHRKILQSTALVMMMAGKTNLTIEEFITFISRINYLDIKSYILNENIIESFLNNQLILNDGKILQFENKELMEFLAAKEIIENDISNDHLYKMVVNEEKEIDSFWFNTITYLVCESKIYRKLILEYIYNNIEGQDNLINLLFNINFEKEDKEYVKKVSNKIIFQYTKLYQYMGYTNNSILNIISVNYKDIFKILTDILIKIDFNSFIDEFNVIYINNILSIIDNMLEKHIPEQEELEYLKQFLVNNEDSIMSDRRFNVRYLTIYLRIMDINAIDNLLSSKIINNRLLSIILHECTEIGKLQRLDDIINKYIISYKDRFEEEVYFFMDDTLIKEFIINNYNATRINKLLNKLNSDEDIASFLRFINNNNTDILNKFDRKMIINNLYKRIVKKFLKEDSKSNMQIREEIMFDRRHGDGFEKIIELCIKYKYIQVSDLAKINTSHYIIQYICELIIKKLIEKGIQIQEIYESLKKQELIFYVWKNDISSIEKDKYESEIKRLFPEQYKSYIVTMEKFKNRDYVDIENRMKKILEASNIFYVIDKMYNLLKDNNRYSIIISDTIMKNTFKQIINRIKEYIDKLDVSKLHIKYNNKDKNYTLSYDVHFYSQAIYILNKGNIDINIYNEKNIILLRENNDDFNINYTNKEYKILMNYLKRKNVEGYIRYYFYSIINKIKNSNINEMYEFIFEWIDKYEFEEYEINQLLSVLCDNIEIIDKNKLDKIKKFKENKTCQDLLILLNVESEIINRIKHIKDNLVYSGDIISIEKNYNFEYSSGYYTNPLSKIHIKYIEHIIDITEFAFKKYNEGDYFNFVKYILEMVTNFIKNNIEEPEIAKLIKIIVNLEKNNNNRYLFNICNSISSMKRLNVKQLGTTIIELNKIMGSNTKKIYSYNELFTIVKDVLENNIFEDIKRMNFFELFRNKDGKLNKLNEQTFQFLIGYELNRILASEGFNTKVVYESTGFDKKRSDIQLISEGFIQDIVIETKLIENDDIGNEDKIKQYINNTLNKYRLEFNSPKILFVIINQTRTLNNCNKKLKLINENNQDFVQPILIDLKSVFEMKNK